jgi:lipoprotein-anchoring transpeptidase ErfK/SrfK
VRIEVLLDRAHFSPGVIDGYNGDNVRKAVRAYQSAHQLTPNGRADGDLLQALTAQDQAPALVAYVVSADDVSGPFVQVPGDFEAQSHLQHLGYRGPKEEIAEKFHMDQHLLTRLNANVDFTHAGATIVVASAADSLPEAVSSIVVDKQEKSVQAFNAAGAMIAFFPATIGSQDTPAPSGNFKVANIDFNHTYRFRPDQLPAFHGRYTRAFDIQPGPNNPTGLVWIGLSRPTYGIHGSPEPALISKTESHGCVRLTNWDALELAHAVHRGTPVSFEDATQTAANTAGSPAAQ